MSDQAAFIGICSHVIPDNSVSSQTPQLTLINLRPYSHHICFPAPLYDGFIVFCVQNTIEGQQYNLSFKLGARSFKIITFIPGVTPKPTEAFGEMKEEQDAVTTGFHDGWKTIAVPLKKVNIAIPEIGLYDVLIETDGESTKIGCMYFGKIILPEITSERKDEIRKDPKLTKAIGLTLSCNICNCKLSYHTSLDDNFNPPESINVNDLPDKYSCDCGASTYDMTDTKRDLYKYIGTKMNHSTSEYHANASFINALVSQREAFLDLLNRELREEEYQKFLTSNPFFLTIFAPKSIYPKLSLLGKYTTDFVIVDSRRDLILVEIEKPTTKLVLSDNANHSELTHAIGQLNNWLHIVEEHKLTLINTWKLHHLTLNSVRGVVIAGRDYKYTEEQLKIMKTSNSNERIKVYTYDDLLRAVDVLIDSIVQP